MKCRLKSHKTVLYCCWLSSINLTNSNWWETRFLKADLTTILCCYRPSSIALHPHSLSCRNPFLKIRCLFPPKKGVEEILKMVALVNLGNRSEPCYLILVRFHHWEAEDGWRNYLFRSLVVPHSWTNSFDVSQSKIWIQSQIFEDNPCTVEMLLKYLGLIDHFMVKLISFVVHFQFNLELLHFNSTLFHHGLIFRNSCYLTVFIIKLLKILVTVSRCFSSSFFLRRASNISRYPIARRFSFSTALAILEASTLKDSTRLSKRRVANRFRLDFMEQTKHLKI